MRHEPDALRDPIERSLRAALGGQLTDEQYDDLADAVAEEHRRSLRVEEGLIDPSLTEPGVAYAIHDDDLKLVDVSAGVAALLLAATLNPAMILIKLIPFFYQYSRKRYRLDPDQGLVLRSLKRAPRGGWTEVEVHDDIEQDTGIDLPSARIAQTLESLKDVLREDNTSTSFVAERGHRWVAVDV